MRILLAVAVMACGLVSAAAIEPWKTMKLWPGVAPGEKGDIGPEGERPPRPGQRKVIRIQNVSVPTLSVFKPKKPNGAAVVICPGGGYTILAWDLEGTEVAQWLNGIGVTAVVVKYRVPRRKDRAKHDAPLQARLPPRRNRLQRLPPPRNSTLSSYASSLSPDVPVHTGHHSKSVTYLVGFTTPSGSSPRNSASSNRAPFMIPSSA